MFEVTAGDTTKIYGNEEFIKTFHQNGKEDLYKPPFSKHIINNSGTEVTVIYKER